MRKKQRCAAMAALQGGCFRSASYWVRQTIATAVLPGSFVQWRGRGGDCGLKEYIEL